ncbi:MAG: glycosyltransferase family 39 protein [Acidobacteria bacterium]|nr:glycosyltransferase family 39 protein [Acidobacteriota bacterium]
MYRRSLVIPGLAAVLLLGALLRFHDLAGKSLWEDEIFALNALGVYRLDQEVGPWSSLVRNVFTYYHDDNHPPLFFLLLGAWLKLFGLSAFSVRAFPAVTGLAALPAAYWVARRVFKERTPALLACFIFATSAYLVYYSQETRMYSLVLLLACLSMLSFLKMQEDGGWLSCLGFVLFSALGLYTHYYFVFFVAAQVLYWIFYGDSRIYPFFVGLCGIFLAFIPWLPVLLYQVGQKDHSDLWIRRIEPVMSGAGQVVFQWIYVLFRFTAGENFVYPNNDSALRLILSVVAALVTVAVLQRPLFPLQRCHALLVLWLLVPLTGGFLADLIFQTKTLEMSKYFIPSYPALAMLLALSIVRFPWKPGRVVLLVALLLLNVKALDVYYRVPRRVEWRDVAEYLSSRVGPDDILLSPEPRVYNCVRFYLKRQLKGIQVPYGAPTEYVVDRARAGIGAAPRLWLVSIDEAFTPDLRGLSQKLEQEFRLLSREVIAMNAAVSSFANRGATETPVTPVEISSHGRRDEVIAARGRADNRDVR